MSESRTETDGVATRVVLSYPADLSDRGRWRLEKAYYRTYLAKVHDEASVGDVWEEFTDVGCCGSQLHVPLRVERVTGGHRVTEATEIAYAERDACEVAGGWQVQNELDE